MKEKIIPINNKKKKKFDSEISYIHITCLPPSEDGTCDVFMNHQGDLDLLGFLLENAQAIFEEKRMQRCDDKI